MRNEEAAAVASLLAVSIYGFNYDRKFIVPATAVRIAPGLAVTAKHVTSFVFKELGLRENERFPKQQKKFDGMEVRVAEQYLCGEADDATAPWWYVEGSFPSKVTDLSVLILTPGNDSAAKAESRGRFMRLSLDPPRDQQTLWAYGYVEKEKERRLSWTDSHVQYGLAYDAVISAVRVEQVNINGRRAESREMPDLFKDPSSIDIAGMPSFQVKGDFHPSMSGGPVFNSDVMYGIVSTGMSSSEGSAGLRPYGIAALLRPLLEMQPFGLGGASPLVSIRAAIEEGRIRTT
jgi:hypothetical protein